VRRGADFTSRDAALLVVAVRRSVRERALFDVVRRVATVDLATVDLAAGFFAFAL